MVEPPTAVKILMPSATKERKGHHNSQSMFPPHQKGDPGHARFQRRVFHSNERKTCEAARPLHKGHTDLKRGRHVSSL